MKTLIFVRHGRATEKGPHIDDRSRPTVPEGDAKTHANAMHVKHEVKTIDAIISSGARRAKMTAEVVAKVYGIDRNVIHYDEKLRTDDREDISDIIPGFPKKRDTVVLVGHNPTITDVADHYTKHEG